MVESNLGAAGMILQEKVLVPSRHDSNTETAIILAHNIHPGQWHCKCAGSLLLLDSDGHGLSTSFIVSVNFFCSNALLAFDVSTCPKIARVWQNQQNKMQRFGADGDQNCASAAQSDEILRTEEWIKRAPSHGAQKESLGQLKHKY